MRMKTVSRSAIWVAAWSAVLCAGATVAQAQTAPIVRSQAVTGAPYSAVIEDRHSQTLANGTNIDLVAGVTKQYRDALGRVRMEHYSVHDGQTSETPNLIEIIDPVAGTRYTLNPSTHTAQSLSTSQRPAPGIVSSSDSSTPVAVNAPTIKTGDGARPEFTHASLGNDSMLGVEVTGSRQTIVYPVGSRGNDQPITVVIETWRSNDLRIDMLRKQDDPRTGVVEWRVTQIDRVEPDASLFQVPADYTITER
jgi:hypothetical protein